jgi:anaerobic magnesium-protoporphyrin IX monomethyl ester cyclase
VTSTSPVTLVIPPSAFLLDERVFMHLGILKVAAVLERAGVPVDVLDLSGIANFEDVVRAYCTARPAVTFGITATTPQLPAATRVVTAIREGAPGARIILGGPHVTLVNAARKREEKRGIRGRAAAAFAQLSSEYDVLVAGDGEEAILRALVADPPKLIDADEPGSVLFLTGRQLTEQPFPARHLIDVNSYRYAIDGVPALSVIAQLGCPFECGFCGGRNSPFLRRVRTRSQESVVAEMAQLYETYGTRGFMLYDDELNVNKGVVELMRRIRALQERLGVDFRLRGFIKSELFTVEQAREMFAAGFRWILVGFESGSPRILDNINKKATRDDNSRCMDIARAAGLKVKALMSVGHPGESDETIDMTRSWLLDVRPDDFDVTVITTYPGTPYYDDAVEDARQPGRWIYTAPRSGDRLYSVDVDYRVVADYYKGAPDGGYVSFVSTDALDGAGIVSRRDAVERDVRERLGIPFNTAAPARQFEHSMGQGPSVLPPSILRSVPAKRVAA